MNPYETIDLDTRYARPGNGAKAKDMIDRECGRLTVVARAEGPRHGVAYWRCECSCGTKNVIATGLSLRNGSKKSCGCLQKEAAAKNACRYVLTYQGETMSIHAWSKKTGINFYTLYDRWERGWPIERMFSPPQHG